MTTNAPSLEYLSARDTAKLVRAALKKAFPDQKFSVRSDTYSGGASIDVSWADGPLASEVDVITERFSGADFDGMIDLKTSRYHYLRPDGEVLLAFAPGTGGSGGSIPPEDNRKLARVMPADVRMVRFGADYIFTRRTITDEDAQLSEAGAWLMANCKIENSKPDARGIQYAMFGTEYVSDIARRLVYLRKTGEDWKAAFNRRYG